MKVKSILKILHKNCSLCVCELNKNNIEIGTYTLKKNDITLQGKFYTKMLNSNVIGISPNFYGDVNKIDAYIKEIEEE